MNSMDSKTDENPEENDPLQESIVDRLYNFGYNVKFHVQELSHRNLIDKSCVWMLGKKYVDPVEFQKDLESIIWCSYRKNFLRLIGNKPPEEVGTFTNDTSWGCMIRATQMMLSEALKRKLRKSFESVYHMRKGIVSWLIDGKDAKGGAPYSIQTICEEVYTRDKKKPGCWFKASEIMLALQRIHRSHCKCTASGLDMVVLLEGTVYLDQILNQAGIELPEDHFIDVGSEEPSEEEETKKELVNENRDRSKSFQSAGSLDAKKKLDFINVSLDEGNSKDFRDDEDEEVGERVLRRFEAMKKSNWSKSIFLVVQAQVGLDKVNPVYIPCIKELLSYPESVGMIGGKAGSAYFFVGYQKNDELIYLDPHFVQESCLKKRDVPSFLPSYSCKNPRIELISDIDTSVAFGFYLEGKQEFLNFAERLYETARKESSFISVKKFAPVPLDDEFNEKCSYQESDSDTKTDQKKEFEEFFIVIEDNEDAVKL